MRSWSRRSAREFLKELGLEEAGLDRADSFGIPASGPDYVLHRRRAGGAGVDDPARNEGSRSYGRDSLRTSSAGSFKADAYASSDLFALGSEPAVKEKGLLRSEGK